MQLKVGQIFGDLLTTTLRICDKDTKTLNEEGLRLTESTDFLVARQHPVGQGFLIIDVSVTLRYTTRCRTPLHE